MRPELYQAETERIATQQRAILDEAHTLLLDGQRLSALERNGVLHALQVLINNAIGKGKHWLKAAGQPVPVSAYDTFSALVQSKLLPDNDLKTWNALVGLRNRIVHDYMNIDMERILALVQDRAYDFVVDFLMRASPPSRTC